MITYAETRYATWIPMDSSQDPDGDIRFQILTRGVTATGTLGVLVNPWRGLHLGASARLPTRAKQSGKAWVVMPRTLAQLGQVIEWMPGKDKAEMSTDLPLAVRGGIRYGFRMPGHANAPELADIEFDVIWERWSAVKSMDTLLNASMLGEPMEVFRLPHFYDDVGEFRLGGSFTIPRPLGGGWLTLRLGTFYGNNASPKEYTRLNYAAWARLGLFGGLSYKIAGVDFHLAVYHIWNGDGKPWQPWSFKRTRHVDHSCIQPINAYEAPALIRCDPATMPEAQDISRGTYRASFLTVSLGFQITFDEVIAAAKHRRLRPAVGN
jgi:hypothetical protein